ncbi:MAG: hypothetical protein AAF590_09305 [Pseudomonadota bacterium]
MTCLISTVLAALLGVLLERLDLWAQRRRTQALSVRLTNVEAQLRAERINAHIDRSIASEDDLRVLLDRL